MRLAEVIWCHQPDSEFRRDKVELILLKLFSNGFRVFINAAITIPNIIVLKKNIIAYGTFSVLRSRLS